MHCKELHLNNFKDDFLNISIFLHPQIPDFQILSYHNKPYINGNIIYFRELTLMTGFVVQGHILCNLLAFLIKLMGAIVWLPIKTVMLHPDNVM